MLRSVRISGYRGFSNFSLSGLGRVNLFVGRNNSGKTAILEALSLLSSGADISALWRILQRRGEQPPFEQTPGRPIQQEVDLSHLFTGHEIGHGKELSVITENGAPDRNLTYRIEASSAEESPALFAQIASDEPASRFLALKILTQGLDVPPIPLSRGYSIRQDIFQTFANLTRNQKSIPQATQFIAADSISMPELVNLWNTIVLTPEEDRVIEALRSIDPNIDRIAAVGSPVIFTGIPQRGGFAVRLKGSERRIPIGSFGDGVWRIVSLAAAISRAKGGLLLVDEIDTGLHYSVMEEMWKMINTAAIAFDVQVFATTHSYDCVHSLSTLCNSDGGGDGSISIHRIEPNKENSITFTNQQIKLISERDIEVR